MFLKQKSTGHMLEVLDLSGLFDLHHTDIEGRYQEGEDIQDSAKFEKADLIFLSGESLPTCWTDPHYRDAELKR